MRAFQLGQVEVEVFVRTFLQMFKGETGDLTEKEYEALQLLFGDADSFTTDDSLIESGGGFYIDEQELRRRVARTVRTMRE